MALVKVGERFWTAKTRTEVETQFGNADDFPKDSIVRIVTGADAGDYYWDPSSSATAGAGVIAVPGETGRFLLGASGTSTPSVSSSAAGSAASFPAGERRIFHSDGTTAGGTWAPLSPTDVAAAFDEKSIAADRLAIGANGQVLTTVSGVATWAAPATVTSSANGVANAFPAGSRRIFHSDGSTAGGTWAQLTSTDVSAAFADASIVAAKINIGSGTEGQVIKIVSGVATFTDESGTGASPVTSSVSGTVSAFTASQRRIFHSDGTTAGGVWTQLSALDVTGAFAAASIGAGILTPGTNGQVLTTSGGVATWAAPVTTSLVGTATAGSANQFPSGSRRILHSDGSTAGGTWDQLSALDVTGAFAAGSIGASIITPGTAGQVLTTSGGVATWAAPVTTAAVSSSVAGTATAFPAGSRRIFHSDGSAAGGTWSQLSALDVTGSFAAASIGAGILTPGTNGQVLTTSGGVATWAAAPTTPFVSSSVAGTASAFPAGSRRLFHSDGSTAGGVWTQMSETDVTGAFAAASIASSILKPGTNGQVLTTSGGVATWAAPTLTIAGATTGDMLVYSSGAWNRLPISTEPNAPLVQMAGLPAWAPLSTGPTVSLPAGTSQGLDVSMVGYGDARLVVVDLAGPATLRSINPVGWRPGYYMFQNLSVHTLTVKHNDETATLGTLFFIHGQQDITIPPDHWLMVFYDGMFIVVTDASDKFLGPGVQGDILYRNANQWTTLAAGTAGKSLITGGSGANPSWGYPTSATVILQPGYSGSAPNTYGTFAAAWAAAIAHGGPVTILVQSTGTSLSIPTGVYDGGNRIGFLFQHVAGGLTISMSSSSEIVDITSWANVSVWPDDSSVLTSISMGVGSPHTCGIYLSAASAGGEFLYSGRFSWSGSRYSIRVDSNCAVRMRDLHHTGLGQEIRASDDLRIITENRVVPPQCNSLDSAATLYVLQQAGSVIDPDDFSWNGSGGVVVTKADDVATTAYSAAVTKHWPEGAPAEPRDALDKLAARNPGQLPPGANLAHNKWWTFGKNTEGLNFSPLTEGAAVWVPRFNHWIYLGFLSNNTETDHRNLACGGSQRGMQNLLHQGWWDFETGSDSISSNFKRPFSVVVIPDVRVVVSAQLVTAGTQCVATSDDGGDTWTLRNGHFSSSTNGYRDMVWTGTHIIGIPEVSSSTVGRSTSGITWSSVNVGTTAARVKLISNGDGIVIALTATGAVVRSIDHGANWIVASGISGMAALFDAIWFNGQFIVMSTSGTVWTSTDGATWSSATPITISHPGKTGFTPCGVAYRSIVKCGGVLFGLFRGIYDTFTQGNIFYSLDGITWRDSGVFSAYGIDVVDGTSSRFGIHLASSSMNALSSADTDVHQMCGKMNGVQFDDFDIGSYWFISPAVLANLVV